MGWKDKILRSMDKAGNNLSRKDASVGKSGGITRAFDT